MFARECMGVRDGSLFIGMTGSGNQREILFFSLNPCENHARMSKPV